MSVQEAARILHVHSSRINKLIRDGEWEPFLLPQWPDVTYIKATAILAYASRRHDRPSVIDLESWGLS